MPKPTCGNLAEDHDKYLDEVFDYREPATLTVTISMPWYWR